MKKHLIGAIVLVAVLAFAGCGNNNQKSENTQDKEKPVPNQMLIIVDPQVDFTTGTLATAKGPEAMDKLAETIKKGVLKKYKCVVVTQDAHPENHCSFVEQGGAFPAHCVQGTKGMKVYPALQKALDSNGKGVEVLYLEKGNLPNKEEFSIFQNEENGSKLRKLIESKNFDGVDICGIATDYCVYETTKDLMEFYPASRIRIITNCIAAVDDNDTKLKDLMSENGITSITY
jgi:nicotinamidase/pyrazinamidase